MSAAGPDLMRLIRPSVTFEDVEADFRSIFASGQFTKGDHAAGLRRELAEYVGAPYAHLTTSATTALWSALKVLGVGPGDDVLVSDFSFPASANVVEDLGARPVFVDVSADTYNIVADQVEARLTPRTKAVMFVDALGNPSGLSAVAELCRHKGVPLVEDAACAIGSSEGGVRCGAVADLTCFSFHPRKLLNTGEGGAITTGGEQWSRWLDVKLEHGATGRDGIALGFGDYGYNFRLSELQAAMGRVQLRRLDGIVDERLVIRDAVADGIESTGLVPQTRTAGVRHNVQSMAFTVPPDVERDALVAALRDGAVESTIGTYCLSGTDYYRARYNEVQPTAWRLYRSTITLPCYSGMDVGRLIDAVVSAVKTVRVP